MHFYVITQTTNSFIIRARFFKKTIIFKSIVELCLLLPKYIFFHNNKIDCVYLLYIITTIEKQRVF
jgi:hypothetical protein